MDKLKLVEMAMAEIGDVSAPELSAFIEKQHGVKIAAFFIPVFKATLRDRIRLEAVRHSARALLVQEKAETPAT